MRYRKRPVVVTAERFWENLRPWPVGVCTCPTDPEGPHVHTMHANQAVRLEEGDWVVAELDGVHFYPVKPNVFEMTYEAVNE